MDTIVHNGFTVHMKDGRKKIFTVDRIGLYVGDEVPADCCMNLNINEVEGYTPREVQRARQCRKIFHDLGSTSPSQIQSHDLSKYHT